MCSIFKNLALTGVAYLRIRFTKTKSLRNTKNFDKMMCTDEQNIHIQE